MMLSQFVSTALMGYTQSMVIFGPDSASIANYNCTVAGVAGGKFPKIDRKSIFLKGQKL